MANIVMIQMTERDMLAFQTTQTVTLHTPNHGLEVFFSRAIDGASIPRV